MELRDLLLACYLAFVVGDIVGDWLAFGGKLDAKQRWAIEFRCQLGLAVSTTALSLSGFSEGDAALGWFWGVYATYSWYRTWRIWKRRPPRERERESLFARVVDIGHRLAVQPT